MIKRVNTKTKSESMSQESVKSPGKGERRMKESQDRIMIEKEEEKMKSRLKTQVKIKSASSRDLGDNMTNIRKHHTKNSMKQKTTKEVIGKIEKRGKMNPDMNTEGINTNTEMERIKGLTTTKHTESNFIFILVNAKSPATIRRSRKKPTTKEEKPRPEEQEQEKWLVTATSKATSDPKTKLTTEDHKKSSTKEITKQNKSVNQKVNTEVIGLPEETVTAMMKTGDNTIIIDLLKSYLKSQCRG